MSAEPTELGFEPLEGPILGDLFVADDVGVWRCSSCRRSVPEVDEQGHGSGCAHLRRLEGATPYGHSRRRVVGEWPGLRAAILQDHDLRSNLVGEIVRAYRSEYQRAKKRNAPFLETRGKVGSAFAHLHRVLGDIGERLDELETIESKVQTWWTTGDRLDGRGGPPPKKKKRGGGR